MERTGIKTILFLLAFVAQSHAEVKPDSTVFPTHAVYEITQESEISYAIDLKILLAFQTTISGKTSDIKGEITLLPEPASDSVEKKQPVTGELFVAAGTFRSGVGRRDADIREILQSAKYPQIIFSISGIESGPDVKFSRLSGAMVVKGVLDFKGKKKEIALPVQATPKGDKLLVDGKLELKLSDFGITPPTFGYFLGRTSDNITLTLHLVAENKKAGFFSTSL
ncbi:MAG: YceI family protein [Nitrospinae bacterium]|nr:YceI family protein [Nitrospinota bacterium]